MAPANWPLHFACAAQMVLIWASTLLPIPTNRKGEGRNSDRQVFLLSQPSTVLYVFSGGKKYLSKPRKADYGFANWCALERLQIAVATECTYYERSTLKSPFFFVIQLYEYNTTQVRTSGSSAAWLGTFALLSLSLSTMFNVKANCIHSYIIINNITRPSLSLSLFLLRYLTWIVHLRLLIRGFFLST